MSAELRWTGEQASAYVTLPDGGTTYQVVDYGNQIRVHQVWGDNSGAPVTVWTEQVPGVRPRTPNMESARQVVERWLETGNR